jgi:hypothetical protein
MVATVTGALAVGMLGARILGPDDLAVLSATIQQTAVVKRLLVAFLGVTEMAPILGLALPT